MIFRKHRTISGMTLAEMMVASAILGAVSAALLVGISTLQRTFVASEYHVTSQIEQARILDYIGRDVRRATSISSNSTTQQLNLTIPDYYQSGPKTSYTVNDLPRDPVRVGNTVQYTPTDIPVSYYKRGSTIYRNINGTEVPLVTDVQDFQLNFPGTGTREVDIQVTFAPRYSFRSGNAAMQNGTLVESRVLLRNLR
jgi:prepilin-type N-terminal cleavage/methylation domain-containing protein